VIQDKIALLMEETGCERGEAELALEMCGYQVEEAVKAIGRLLRNIVVLKAKFLHSEQSQYGLFLVVLNLKSGVLLRARAVLSFNPAVCEVPLDKDWFEFEKALYGCRLWDGSLQGESLELEQRLSEHFRAASARSLERVETAPAEELAAELSGVLRGMFKSPALSLKLRKDILDLGQFQSLGSDGSSRPRGRPARSRLRAEELLVLAIALEEDPRGMAAGDLRAGDMVSARIVDPRDIAQYLAKLFGGHSQRGQVPILVPVEAIEAVAPSGVLARVRFSRGVCGDALVPRESRLKAVRVALRNQELSWWRRFLWP